MSKPALSGSSTYELDFIPVSSAEFKSVISDASVGSAIWDSLTFQRGLFHRESITADTDKDWDLTKLGEFDFDVEFSALSPASFSNNIVLRLSDGTMLHIYTYSHYGSDLGHAAVEVAADTLEKASELATRVKRVFKVSPPPQDAVAASFWAMGPHGASSVRRKLKVPSWEEIRMNYGVVVQEELDTLVSKQPDPESGLLLWTGPPGTGKTTAIRALIREWGKWCDICIITDPENFLNSVSYLNSVILEGSNDNGKPILLVLEDAGELITADARANTGQALSRLLNITDGLLGQGMNLYVLITTNEDVGKLHGAAMRPGRCICNLEFSDLTTLEARTWAKAHNLDCDIDHRASLAELYALLSGNKKALSQRKKGSLGFSV